MTEDESDMCACAPVRHDGERYDGVSYSFDGGVLVRRLLDLGTWSMVTVVPEPEIR